MKKIYLAFLLLAIIQITNANNISYVDSLYKKLINAHDSLKPNILNDLCWELRNSEPEKSLSMELKQ